MKMKQQGMVLFFSLIVLLIMTVIGVALAVNSTQSIRMAGAGAERVEAMAAAQGALEKVLASNEGTTLTNINADITVADGVFNVSSTLTSLSNGEPVGCLRSLWPHQADKIKCMPIEVTSQSTFGRDDMGRLTVVVGIEQERLP